MATEAAMGLLTGDVLASMAVAVALFLLMVDLMHRRVACSPACTLPAGPHATAWAGQPAAGELSEHDLLC